MKIERIRVDAFGTLSDFDTGAETLGPLVVVLGPNEAGKSTLFEFLTTALYGFHPASRERNPHVPWGAEEASGRVQLRIGAGECVSVERRLRSTPSGSLTSGGLAVREGRPTVNAGQANGASRTIRSPSRLTAVSSRATQ